MSDFRNPSRVGGSLPDRLPGTPADARVAGNSSRFQPTSAVETGVSTPGHARPGSVSTKLSGSERATVNGSPLGGLKRLLEEERPPRPRPGEKCELCGVPIPDEHSHVVNVHNRSLLCSCRACYLLFTQDGSAQGRFRAVPDRYLYDPAFALSNARWDELQIPVAMAFFFINSALDRFVAFYPSPAGATESLLPLDTWDEIMTANPRFGDVSPDVEALLINRTGGASECYLAPISDCYELVGRVRLHWRGFAGGDVVWREIETFFTGLRERSGFTSAVE